MIHHFLHLFEYDHWADRRTIEALRNNNSGRSLQIFAHLLITKQEYFERLHGKDSTGFNFWPDLSIEECRALAESIYANYKQLLDKANEETLDNETVYKTSEGVPYRNSYRELLTHVLFHALIHRGNIVLKMREEGFEPPKVDYILYLRDREK
jgi:uncharacterized damage-inducible protein DinB